MNDARRAVFTHGLPRVRQWAVWDLPRPLIALWSAVLLGYLVWIGQRLYFFHFRFTDIALFAALLACGAFSVEMSRRASESAGVVKDVYAVWELPVVLLLPSLYALIVPLLRLTITQWRVRRAPVYRRAYTAATLGIAYGCARMVYVHTLPAGVDPRAYLWSHTAVWLVAAAFAAVTQWVVNQALILPAYKLENPAASIRGELLGRETLHNDATELCAALLVAVGMTISALTLIIALPLTTLLQRSFRHTQLLSEARADSKTGLLNAATWEREASAEVARGIRAFSPLAVALLDLDRFKQINDTYGHLVGDDVLRKIASTMTDVLRDYDLAGRFGGEEFVMLLPHTRAPDALRIAERVRAHIARMGLCAPNGEPITVTVSIGVAALDAGSAWELPELLSAADAALYRAKASGRDQVQMISTNRGLSAVGPAAESGEIWHGGRHSPGPQLPAGPFSPAGPVHRGDPVHAGDTGHAGDAVYPGERELPGERMTARGTAGRARPGAARVPGKSGAGVDGSASTSTTSALAV
jgi:diguanylate cyclase (GGDEF)-like protein